MMLSFIIPVYHGEKTIDPLFHAIKASCEKNLYPFEVVFVWDCGPDKSWEVITTLKSKYPSLISAIRLSRNYGQHNAIICGFEQSKGDLIITLDEDLQHDPEDVVYLVKKHEEKNCDVVYGYHHEKKHNSFRNITSRLLKAIMKFGIPELHNHYSAYRLIKRDIALATTQMQNSYTFLDGYLSWITSNIGSVAVKHQPRLAGKSSYNLKMLLKHSVNIFVTFSSLPIKFVSGMSLLFFLFTTGYSLNILIKRLLLNDFIPGFASIIVLTGFGIGSILFGISVLGEYIHRINLKTTRRPNYIIYEMLK